MRLVLVEPEIPQNVGASIRAAACFGAGLHIVEPCGFPAGAKEIARVAMDYGLISPPVRHDAWSAFCASRGRSRLILLTTRGDAALWNFDFQPDDSIVVGSESAGAPPAVHQAADARVRIPMAAAARSLNVSVAAAIALAEARRQTGWTG